MPALEPQHVEDGVRAVRHRVDAPVGVSVCEQAELAEEPPNRFARPDSRY
jgi:hypothetical protein